MDSTNAGLKTLDKRIKIASVEGGPFNRNNIIHFQLPEGNYNLSKSFINLKAELDYTPDSDANVVDAVYNMSIRYTDDAKRTSVPNVSFVKNVRFDSGKYGNLESIKRVDVLRTNLIHFSESKEEMDGRLFKSVSGQYSKDYELSKGNFVDYYNEGDVLSSELEQVIQIPLKDLLNAGQVEAFPVDKLGGCVIECEFNLDKWTVLNLQGKGTRNNRFGGTDNTLVDDISATGNITTLTVSNTFESLDLSPYYVGQPIQIHAATRSNTGTQTDIVGEKRTITQINYNRATKKLTLTLNASLANNPAGESYTGVSLDGVDVTSVGEILFNTAEIVLYQNTEFPDIDEFEWTTFTNEEDFASNVINFSRQYHLESNAINLYVMFPKGGNNNSDLKSKNDDVQYYRLRVDNEDVTNRDVYINTLSSISNGDNFSDPLHYDLLHRTFLNSGKQLKNLYEEAPRQRREKLSQTYQNNKLLVLGTPLNITNNPKLFDLEIGTRSGGNGVSKLILFKEVVKSIKL